MANFPSDKSGLLQFLIERGDWVTMHKGRVSVISSSGEYAPEVWLRSMNDFLTKQILESLNREYFTYLWYDTGKFDNGRLEGVILHFFSPISGKDPCAIFNCSLKRKRNRKNSVAGSQLPKGRFSVTQRHYFLKFWILAGLPIPRSLTTFHDCMSKLKGIAFTGMLTPKGKLRNETLKPIEVSFEEIKQLFVTDKTQTSTGQITDNFMTKSPDIKTPKTLIELGVPVNSSERQIKSGHKVNSIKGHSNASPPSLEDIMNQSDDEWLDDYDRS